MEGKPYNNKSDIWSLGCVLYEIVALKHAFTASSMSALAVKIIRGRYPPVSTSYSSGLRGLITDMLASRSSKRPNIATILVKPVIRKRLEALSGMEAGAHRVPDPLPRRGSDDRRRRRSADATAASASEQGQAKHHPRRLGQHPSEKQGPGRLPQVRRPDALAPERRPTAAGGQRRKSSLAPPSAAPLARRKSGAPGVGDLRIRAEGNIVGKRHPPASAAPGSGRAVSRAAAGNKAKARVPRVRSSAAADARGLAPKAPVVVEAERPRENRANKVGEGLAEGIAGYEQRRKEAQLARDNGRARKLAAAASGAKAPGKVSEATKVLQKKAAAPVAPRKALGDRNGVLGLLQPAVGGHQTITVGFSALDLQAADVETALGRGALQGGNELKDDGLAARPGDTRVVTPKAQRAVSRLARSKRRRCNRVGPVRYAAAARLALTPGVALQAPTPSLDSGVETRCAVRSASGFIVLGASGSGPVSQTVFQGGTFNLGRPRQSDETSPFRSRLARRWMQALR